MKKRQLFIFIFFLSITGLTFGQEVPSMTFTTTLEVGSNINMSFNADGADRPNIWIDWNHNGVRDEGEGVSPNLWGHWGQRQAYSLKSKTIIIYGKVKQFGAESGSIINADVRNNTNLTYLWLQSNQIKSIDLSGHNNLLHLQLSANQIEGVLDVSHMTLLQQLNIDRNKLEGVKLGTHTDLFQINFSRNYISEEAVQHVISSIPLMPGLNKADGNFYLIDTRATYPEYAEGNQLKQYHLDNAVFNGKWRPRDVNVTAIFRNISRITDLYKLSFTTEKEAGSQISLNIEADEIDRNNIWVDLNGNGIKDTGEGVITFGSNVNYTVSSQNFTVHGPITDITSSGNDLSKFDFVKNPFLNNVSSIDLSKNKLSELKLTVNYLTLKNLNIAGNNLSTVEITNVINKLADRSSTTPGTLTLLNLEGEEGNGAINDHITFANAKNYVVKDGAGNILSPNDIKLLDQTMSALENIETYQSSEIILPEKTDQGLIVSYSIEEGKDAIATLNGNTLTTLRHGDLKITATQTGNINYKPFTKTIAVTVMPAGDVFNWLEMPAISVIGNYVTLVGPEEALSHFTKLFINGEEVEMEGYDYDLTGHTGTLEVKATSEDGIYMMRVTVEK